MADLAPYLGDELDVSIGGMWYTCYDDMTGPSEPDYISIPETRGRAPVDVPRRYRKESYKFNCQDETGSAKWLALKALMDARAAVACIVAFEGNVAGNLTASGNAYVGVSGLSAGPGKPGTFTLTLNFTAEPTYAPNLALSTLDFGSVAAGGAASGYNDPTASGGTSTYTITMEDEDGVPSALPEGVTWSGSAFAGTVDAGANVGMYRLKVKVVDSAATPVVAYFLGTLRVTA